MTDPYPKIVLGLILVCLLVLLEWGLDSAPSAESGGLASGG
jgi:hypothetical protein